MLPYGRQYEDLVEPLAGSGKEPGKGCGEGEGHKKKEQRTTSIIYVIGWKESKAQ